MLVECQTNCSETSYVLVRQSQLVHSLQNLLKSGLFVSQQLTRQLLQDEGNVVENDGVMRSHPPGLQKRHLGFLKLSVFRVCSGQVEQYLDVVRLVELLQTVFVHLNGSDVLVLLDVHVGDIEPDIAEVSGGLADLGEDLPSFDYIALVRQDGADAVSRPDILWIVAQNLLVHRQRPFLLKT